MATPTLALVPSGYKATKLYSVLPTDGSGDFDFSRASSATRVNSEGLIELVSSNVPRLDYPLLDGTVQTCPHLLLESQRTNYISSGEDFSFWTISGTVTVTDNQIISPDGTLNASTLDFTSAVSEGNGVYRFTGDLTGSLSRSIYLKGAVGGETVDLSDPHMGGGSNITLTTEWQRFEYISTAENTNSGIWLKNSVGNVIHAWGAQLEEGSYPTSYIPTQGAIATRLADSVTGAGDATLFSSVNSSGVLFAEIASLSDDGTNRYISLNDGGLTNAVQLRYSSVTNQLIGIVEVGSSTQTSMGYTLSDETVFNKIALRYAENDFSLWVNGVKVVTDTSGSIFPSSKLLGVNFDAGNGSTFKMAGKTKQVAVYNYLTDAQMITLTTL